jgi:hypothetical protein
MAEGVGKGNAFVIFWALRVRRQYTATVDRRQNEIRGTRLVALNQENDIFLLF